MAGRIGFWNSNVGMPPATCTRMLRPVSSFSSRAIFAGPVIRMKVSTMTW